MPRLALPALLVLALAVAPAPASAVFHQRHAVAVWPAGDARVQVGGLERVEGTSTSTTSGELRVDIGSCARGDRATAHYVAVLPMVIDPTATTARVAGAARATGEERRCDGTAPPAALPPVPVSADLTWRPAREPIARAYGPVPGFGCTGAAVVLAHHFAAVTGTMTGSPGGVALDALGASPFAFTSSSTSAGAC